MAALEKIRSKAVLLVVFIGVALLAFILTDLGLSLATVTPLPRWEIPKSMRWTFSVVMKP